MTSEHYFEMCEAMGAEPIEEEIPIEYHDLLLDVQEAIRIYNGLSDQWDYMNGNYIGKNMAGFADILDIYETPKEDRRTVYELILHIDRIRSKIIQENKPKTPPKSPQ